MAKRSWIFLSLAVFVLWACAGRRGTLAPEVAPPATHQEELKGPQTFAESVRSASFDFSSGDQLKLVVNYLSTDTSFSAPVQVSTPLFTGSWSERATPLNSDWPDTFEATLECDDAACVIGKVVLTKKRGTLQGSATLKFQRVLNASVFEGMGGDVKPSHPARDLHQALSKYPYQSDLLLGEVEGSGQRFFEMRFSFAEDQGLVGQPSDRLLPTSGRIAGAIGDNQRLLIELTELNKSKKLARDSRKTAPANAAWDPSRSAVSAIFLEDAAPFAISVGTKVFKDK